MFQIFEKDDLIKMIEALRLDMIKIGLVHGLSSKKVIQLSEQLDYYIVQYQTLHIKNDNKTFH
ncbi:aspartyl-phosphate phosphatase Spo0E family protein [Bacillus dakarensis]|uniref:aspartyl-phosphate phosphatase Spo0E family protein n=1 Tax=Robertmurraya dakarensis TaxID=1926278 RepID=UPI0009810261|nr:aspartyl-phosphate phosphatase Spo0E family protein [Bacillus dakarensis]